MVSQIVYTVLTGAVLALFILFNHSLQLRLKVLFWVAILLVIVVLPISYYEQKAAQGILSVELRTVLSAWGYALKVMITYVVFAVMAERKLQEEWKLFLPAAINGIISLLTIRTGWVFTITADNVFRHGPLYYLPMIIGACYLVATFRRTIRQLSKQPTYEIWLGMAVGIQIFVAFVLVVTLQFHDLFSYTIPISLVFYYIWVETMLSKLDDLTGVLNRCCFEMDADHLVKKGCCGIITIDMNNLKTINDCQGHLAGDKALRSLTQLAYHYLPFAVRLYRIGGDEFMALWPNTDAQRLELVTEQLRIGLQKLPFGAAVGCYLHTDRSESMEEAVNRADQAMYRDKQRIKQQTEQNEQAVQAQ